MTKLFSQLTGGTLGFTIGPPLLDALQQPITDTLTQAGHALEKPNNYLIGLAVSGVIQIAMKLIDVWQARRKAKKQATDTTSK